jgi:hypothetical protein
MNHPNGPNGNCAKRYRTSGSGTKEKNRGALSIQDAGCEVQQQSRRSGAAIQNPPKNTNYTAEDKVPDTRRKTMSLIRQGRPFVFLRDLCAEFQFPKSGR